MFKNMHLEGIELDEFTYTSVVSGCANSGLLLIGKQVHASKLALPVNNALVTLYCKCGKVDQARQIFDSMLEKDHVSWNEILSGYVSVGRIDGAKNVFSAMPEKDLLTWMVMISGFAQNGKQYHHLLLIVLTACSHSGLVKEGCKYFESMDNVYGITPDEDHYARFIDLLCRAGKISEANYLIQNLPFKPGAPIWEALLNGCWIHGNMEVGIQAADQLFQLTPQHDGTYILLANMYADAGRREDMEKVRMIMREQGVKKEPGCSWLEVANKVHVFLVDDTSHPQVHEVYTYLRELGVKMRKLGYVPDTKYVLHDMESEHKEYALSTHCERLAVGFGLLKLPRGALSSYKNLRICGDCHIAFKFISKLFEREIVVRDGRRFHHFRNGECSYGNYW
ncbi:hypothetical protein MKW92_013730 [Papaver armeniacum]|nr:hypothetical protein MKW92_013730 [Papaver armeniacum]